MSELIQASLDDNPNNEQSGAWSQSSPILCFHQKIARVPLFWCKIDISLPRDDWSPIKFFGHWLIIWFYLVDHQWWFVDNLNPSRGMKSPWVYIASSFGEDVRSSLRQKFNWDQVCRPCESKDKWEQFSDISALRSWHKCTRSDVFVFTMIWKREENHRGQTL